MIDINVILKELKYLPKYEEQIMLQRHPDSDNFEYGTESWVDLKHPESEFILPIYDKLEYTNLIMKTLGMSRTRVMKVKAKSCYSYHRDLSERIHIQLITNEKCFFVIENEVIRLPADGNYYVIDTRKMHTFVNASFEDRIHIVGCIHNK